MKDQPLGACLSICLNLAEESGKSCIKDRRRFYEIALARHYETQAIFNLIQNTELIRTANCLGGGLFNLVRGLTPEAD